MRSWITSIIVWMVRCWNRNKDHFSIFTYFLYRGYHFKVFRRYFCYVVTNNFMFFCHYFGSVFSEFSNSYKSYFHINLFLVLKFLDLYTSSPDSNLRVGQYSGSILSSDAFFILANSSHSFTRFISSEGVLKSIFCNFGAIIFNTNLKACIGLGSPSFLTSQSTQSLWE